VLGEQPDRESVAEFAVWGAAEAWTAPLPAALPAAVLAPPEIRLQQFDLVDGAYEVELLAWSQRGAFQLDLRVADASEVSELWIEGRATAPRGGLLMRFHAPPPAGVRLRLRTSSPRLELVVIDRTFGPGRARPGASRGASSPPT